jgi:NTP pyrophosphatase (non-canonical NTP hydrolase)
MHMKNEIVEVLKQLQQEIHAGNVKAGWWTDLTAIPEQANLVNHARRSSRLGKAIVAEKLALVHSEVTEALEGARKNLQDDKLPHRSMLEVELADAVIRILDLAGAMNLDVAAAMQEKMLYNSNREDHKIENRMKPGGKAY